MDCRRDSGLLLALIVIVLASAPVFGDRLALSLDGRWQIAQGDMDTPPATFRRQAPVPGLVDLAEPAFTEVGVPSDQRRAFWYSRRFRVPGPPRDVAVLKIGRARFGTRVWLNGIEVGEHLACFTPGHFDVSHALRYDAANTLVVRVGAFKDAVPQWVPTGTDKEKSRWIPGIYDSVSLVLADRPYISSIQVAPHIADGSATVQVTLRNPGDRVRDVLKIGVREWRSRRSASDLVERPFGLRAGQERTITSVVHMKSPKLWSPERPFLYVVRVESAGDAVETRFGMREFRYDAATGRAYLNGRPYYLRGTNFCLFRFFEDPQRGGLPWDRRWVRRLLTQGRRVLHWNSARVCIAPAPQFWYDLADETGWLLQNEFPIWGFDERWSQEELIREFTEWMEESWNHPSVVVWDACNETLTPRTGDIIRAVRGLDLSQRPWDNGYSPPVAPNDAREDHPYRFIRPGFELERLERLPPVGTAQPPERPVVINEYGWLWLNRDGTPTTLTERLYGIKLGPQATPEQRRDYYAYTEAALTEYWRARRHAAGVQHFCYLTYSRPGGQTSDNFVDLRQLTLEPRFREYMRHAFSPLGLMLDHWATLCAPGARLELRVVITNDRHKEQRGELRLRVTDRDEKRRLSASRTAFRVEPLGQAECFLPAALPAQPGEYRLVAELAPVGGEAVKSRRRVTVVSEEEARSLVNLALNRPVTASSQVTDHRGNCPVHFAVDGDLGTRWSSEFSDPQWIAVDLGQIRQVRRVVLDWEAAHGKAYRIQVSTDGTTWTDAWATENGQGGHEEIELPPTPARHVRLSATKRGTPFGYSLWEFQVFE